MMARFDAQKVERDNLVTEIATKQTELSKLNEEIRQKNTAPGLTQLSSKVDYFEGEVRRLESQLTQQKVSYERQISQLKQQLESAN